MVEPSSARQLRASLRNMGRESDLSSAEIRRYIQDMRGAGSGQPRAGLS